MEQHAINHNFASSQQAILRLGKRAWQSLTRALIWTNSLSSHPLFKARSHIFSYSSLAPFIQWYNILVLAWLAPSKKFTSRREFVELFKLPRRKVTQFKKPDWHKTNKKKSSSPKLEKQCNISRFFTAWLPAIRLLFFQESKLILKWKLDCWSCFKRTTLSMKPYQSWPEPSLS